MTCACTHQATLAASVLARGRHASCVNSFWRSRSGRLAQRTAAYSGATESTNVRSSTYNVQYDVYKGRSAIQFKPIMPTFGRAQDGNTELKRRGCMLLELANSDGKRSYAWGEKITFAMSVTEMSQTFLSNVVLSGQGVDLFHDPGMGSAQQGQIKKSMKVQMLPDNLNVNIAVTETQTSGSRTVSVPVSSAEFLVVAEMCRYLIPRFIGLNELSGQHSLDSL
eukprot:jgi/Ulvmu1/7329/UM035_0118.1